MTPSNEENLGALKFEVGGYYTKERVTNDKTNGTVLDSKGLDSLNSGGLDNT